ncbi:hypothetical protein C8J56DRAFT_940378, partial [Mycena floridula]
KSMNSILWHLCNLLTWPSSFAASIESEKYLCRWSGCSSDTRCSLAVGGRGIIIVEDNVSISSFRRLASPTAGMGRNSIGRATLFGWVTGGIGFLLAAHDW